MPGLHIRTLGEFTVRRGDVIVPADAWPTQKSLSLFKLLVTERGRRVSGARLLETLWPALPAARAQNNLWVTVGQARRVLEPHLAARASSTYILSEKEGYRFNTAAPYSLDAEAFEHLVDAGLEAADTQRLVALEAARALYRGDYLPDDRGEEWAQPTRAALLDRFLTLSGALAALYIRAGRQRDAMAACRDGLRSDGTHEYLAQLLMLSSALLGDQEAAVRAYDEHRAALAAAAAAPSAATEQLLARIRSSPIADTAGLPAAPAADRRRSLDHPPLVGRSHHLRVLDRALAHLREGRREIVLVEGEPGSGKSRLLEEFAARAESRGVRALCATCYEADRAAPYLATAEMIAAAHARWPDAAAALPAPLRADLALLCPAVAPYAARRGEQDAARPGGQARLPRALIAYMRALAGDGGLLLCLDDMQWADTRALAMVQRLAVTSGGPPILAVGAYAGEELGRNAALADLLRRVGSLPTVIHMALGRLGAEHVDQMVHTLAGERTDVSAPAAWLHQAAAGNPLFTVTLLRDLAERGVLPLRGARAWQVDAALLPAPDPAPTLPEALRALLRERVERLPAAARRVLECAAVAGRPTAAATLQRLAGEGQGAFGTRLDDLARRGLLRPTTDGARDAYALGHDKICEVVYGEIGAARRVALHGALGALLEQDDASRLFPALPALHFEEGQEWARAVCWLERAARAALRLGAGQEALRFCTRAIALGRAHPEETPPALLRDVTELRGRTRLHLGSELPGATEDLKEVIAQLGASEPGRCFDLRLALGLALANHGPTNEARAQFDEALLIAEALDDPARRVEATCGQGAFALMRGENDRAAARFGAALALCDAHGLGGRPRAGALQGRGEAHWLAGAPRAAIRCYEESLTLAQRAGERDLEEKNLRTLAWAYTGGFGVADHARALAPARETLLLNEGAEPWHLPLTLSVLGHTLACTGDYAGGLDHLRAAADLARARDQHPFVCIACDLLGDLYGDLRLYQPALAAHEAALAAGERGEAGIWLERARANIAAARFRLGSARAREELEAALDRARVAGLGLHVLRALEASAELGVATRDVYAALHYAELLGKHAAREGMRSLEAAALRWRGAARALQGGKAAALDDLRGALALATQVGRVQLQWELHAALASLLRGEDDESAREHAVRAQALLAQTAARLEDPALRVGLLALHRQLDER